MPSGASSASSCVVGRRRRRHVIAAELRGARGGSDQHRGSGRPRRRSSRASSKATTAPMLCPKNAKGSVEVGLDRVGERIDQRRHAFEGRFGERDSRPGRRTGRREASPSCPVPVPPPAWGNQKSRGRRRLSMPGKPGRRRGAFAEAQGQQAALSPARAFAVPRRARALRRRRRRSRLPAAGSLRTGRRSDSRAYSSAAARDCRAISS